MNFPIQGIIACSGQGSRFARSIGVKAPYPKHLEKVGNQTILRRTVESMIRYIPVTGITVSLNPDLQGPYLSELERIATSHRNLKFSYLAEYPQDDDYKELFTELGQGVLTLDGRKLNLGNPLVAFVHGDLILNGDGNEFHSLMQTILPRLSNDEKRSISTGGIFGGAVYCISKLHIFNDGKLFPILTDIGKYGIHSWNINSIDDLIEAKNALGFRLTGRERY